LQEWLYMRIQQTVILSSLCKWKRQKMVVFVVKRYAVREAEQWRYAVRNAKLRRYAVRKGVTLNYKGTWQWIATFSRVNALAIKGRNNDFSCKTQGYKSYLYFWPTTCWIALWTYFKYIVYLVIHINFKSPRHVLKLICSWGFT